MVAMLLAALGLEAGLAMARGRHVLGLVRGARIGRIAPVAARADLRRGPMGRADTCPATARLIGQDHRGFYIPRPYTMELAHRRRTGLGRRGEVAGRDRRAAARSRASPT